jgi:hypothetical protein
MLGDFPKGFVGLLTIKLLPMTSPQGNSPESKALALQALLLDPVVHSSALRNKLWR